MPACASDCLFEVTAAIAASAADITLLRSIMKGLDEKLRACGSTAQSIAQRARPGPSTSRYGDLTQRDDEVGAFAGFTALVDAVIGHYDRTAGGQDFGDPRHRLRSDGDAVQRLGGAIRRRQRLGLGSAGHLAAAGSAVVLVGPGRIAGR